MTTPRNVILAQDKGMSGKSLIAAAIALEAVKRKLRLTAVEIESTPRMSAVYPKIFTHQAITPADEDVVKRNSIEFVLGFYDDLMLSLQRGGLLVDTGSNVTKAALSKMRMSAIDAYIGRGADTAFIVPATANGDSLVEGAHIVAQIIDVLPEAPIFLIENEKDGPLPTTGRWIEVTRRPQVTVLTLPKCASEHWASVSARPLNELIALDREALMKMGLSPAQAQRALDGIVKFIWSLFGIASTVVDWMTASQPAARKSA